MPRYSSTSREPLGAQINAANFLVPDLLAPNLKLLFCGTAPSTASAAAKAYYAKPGNKFWPTLHAVGITPRRFAPLEYPALLALDIGLTDLCKIHAGTDAELPKGAFDISTFEAKLGKYRPKVVAFTSKNAAQNYFSHPVEYGWQAGEPAATRFFVLTSPSGLATRFFDIDIWRELADSVKQNGE
jgi:double-stranded uracil-DNA glycosylase